MEEGQVAPRTWNMFTRWDVDIWIVFKVVEKVLIPQLSGGNSLGKTALQDSSSWFSICTLARFGSWLGMEFGELWVRCFNSELICTLVCYWIWIMFLKLGGIQSRVDTFQYRRENCDGARLWDSTPCRAWGSTLSGKLGWRGAQVCWLYGIW